jgi:hypothetical protein
VLYCAGRRYPIIRDPDEAFKRATRCSHEPEKNHRTGGSIGKPWQSFEENKKTTRIANLKSYFH